MRGDAPTAEQASKVTSNSELQKTDPPVGRPSEADGKVLRRRRGSPGGVPGGNTNRELKDRNAKLDLGVMNADGRGVPQDYVRAHMWFSLSAAQGEQRAVKLLEMAERRMTPAQITEAQKLARDWKPAAGRPDTPAMATVASSPSRILVIVLMVPSVHLRCGPAS
jgi:hypothetical protein